MSPDVSIDGDRVTFSVRVVPRASKSELLSGEDGTLRLRIASPPVDGAANDEIVRFLSKAFGVSKGSVSIVSGDKSKVKRICVSGACERTLTKIDEILCT